MFPRSIRFGWETAKKHPIKNSTGPGSETVIISKIDTSYGTVPNRTYRAPFPVTGGTPGV